MAELGDCEVLEQFRTRARICRPGSDVKGILQDGQKKQLNLQIGPNLMAKPQIKVQMQHI
jgi:hypothetical protein